MSFYAGGNDILSLRTDMADLTARYEAALARLTASGARVLVFTAFDTRTSALLEPLRRRVLHFNDQVRRLAEVHGAVLLDHTLMREYDDPRLWAPDKLHMSRQGHKRMAAFVMAEGLRVPHTLKIRDLGPREPRRWRQALVDELGFVRSEVVPLVRSRIQGRRDGESIPPKWPEPIHPAMGIKRLASTRSGAALRDRARRTGRPA